MAYDYNKLKMKVFAQIALLLSATQAVTLTSQATSYPYFTVSDSKGTIVKAHGGKPEFEPLETGTMKTMPNIIDLTKNIFKDAYKEKPADKDSIEERIKGHSRHFGDEDSQKVADKLALEKDIIHYDNRKAWELGIAWNPK